MKPFDLKAALAGAKVITRDGRDVPSVRYYPNNGTCRVVLADVTLFGKNDVAPHSFYADGVHLINRQQSEHDLFMAEDKPSEIDFEKYPKKETELEAPSNTQVGGSHYKDMAIQPIDFILKNGLGFCEGNVIKYVCRHRAENGRQDLEKAIHYIQLLIEKEYENKI